MMLSLQIKSAPDPGAFCCSMNPMHRTRGLLPGNGDLRPEQDREMSSCVINQILLICERTLRAYLTEFYG